MLVAGRSMPIWLSVFTVTATWAGGGYITGTAESVYASGFVWTQAPWAYSLSLIIGGIFFARKMRRYEFMTMLDPMEARFGKKMASVLYLPALLGEVFWGAAVLVALGSTFALILGLDFSVSIIISAVVALGYTIVGGLWAVAFTDLIQFPFMFFGLFLVLPFAFVHVGGLGEAFSYYASSMGDAMSFFPPLMGWADPEWGNYYWNWWDFALLLVFGGIPWQIYFQRVLAAKSANAAMWLSIAGGILCALVALPSALIGIAGFNADWQSLGTSGPENASMVLSYVFKYMTPGIVGAIGLGALASAVLAAVSASMLSASGMAAWNVYRPLVRPQATQQQLSKIIRKSIIIIGTTATIIALKAKSVYVLWYLCSDLVYVLLFPPLVLALFYKYANTYGAMAGFIVSLVLRIGGGEPMLGLPPLLPYPMVENGVVLFPFRTFAMLCGLITIIVVSYFTRRICPPMALRNLHRNHGESKETGVTV
jgi:high affinity choline transporter 7